MGIVSRSILRRRRQDDGEARKRTILLIFYFVSFVSGNAEAVSGLCQQRGGDTCFAAPPPFFFASFFLSTWEKSVASLLVSHWPTSGLSSAENITYIFEDLAGEY